MNFKESFCTAAFGLLFLFAGAQEDYRKIFSSDYQKALQFLEEEKWMNETIQTQGLQPREIIAVIFPELIRYNAIQDKIETFALESLYIQYGRDYANFSVGQFQIKPSFAENIEMDYLKSAGESELKTLLNIAPNDTVQNQTNRQARLKRIKDKKMMLRYICVYWKLAERKFSPWKTEEEKIKFLACAYNYDFKKSKSEIEQFISKKFFHIGMMAAKKYCYSDIAWHFYKNK